MSLRPIADLISSGAVVYMALAILAAEALALGILMKHRVELLPWIANIASGASLMLALYSALTDRGPFAVGLWLTAGFIAHIIELTVRLRAVRDRPRP